MFEAGQKLKTQYGENQVCDLSLGNPILEPPPQLHQTLNKLLSNPTPGMHRYPSNAGLPAAKEAVAQWLQQHTNIPYQSQHILITCGAAGALNTLFKTILPPQSQVLTPAPFFVEYQAYAANHGATLVTAPTTPEFQLDLPALERLISPQTYALLLNSPNNPSGALYPEKDLKELVSLLQQKSKQLKRPIPLISDEPYRRLVFDGQQTPWLPPLYPHTLIVGSFSKDLGIAGERLGYIAVHPQISHHSQLIEALATAHRTLGFVNAPLLLQRALPQMLHHPISSQHYQDIRDLLLPALQKLGIGCVKPQGAFFLFPQSPIPDDIIFAQKALQQRLLIAPGSGFGGPGHFRISLSISKETAERAVPKFEQLMKSL